jgi:hypothetical protein
VLIDAMRVSSRRVRLPDLDERLRDGAAVLVEDAPLDDDPLALGLARMLPREVVVARFDPSVRVHRPGQFRERVRDDDQRLFRMAQSGTPVSGRIIRWMDAF